MSWSVCAAKGPLFQPVRVLPRQRSSQPGSYPNGCGGNEAFGADGVRAHLVIRGRLLATERALIPLLLLCR